MKNIRTPTVVGLIKAEIEANKELPDISSADAGKLATVDSNGKWTAANLTVGQGEVAVDSTLLVAGAAADAKVTGDKVAELKSAINKIAEFEIGTNLNNPETITTGYMIGWDGAPSAASAYNISDFIPVTPGNKYSVGVYKSDYGTLYKTRTLSAFYDASKTYLTGSLSNVDDTEGLLVTAPEGAAFARISGHTNYSSVVYGLMIAESETILSYFVPYQETTTIIADIPMLDNLAPLEGTAVEKFGANMFDPSTAEEGLLRYDGVVVDSPTGTRYSTSAFIPVNKNTDYYVARYNAEFSLSASRIIAACYDEYKNFISASYINTDNVSYIVINSGTYSYIKISGRAELEGAHLSVSEGSLPSMYYAYDGHTYSELYAEADKLPVYPILYGKKWAVCGDSFTNSGGTGTVLESGMYKGRKYTYPWIIGNRNHMQIVKFFEGGRTLAFPATPGDFTNSLTCTTASCYYQNIPSDVDYITIYLGINDEHHATGGGDGEDPTGYIPLGTIEDDTTASYYGAWNVVLTWLITNRPNAHIGIIVTNGLTNVDYRTAQINIAKKYGIPYIDLNGDERTPAMLRTVNPDIPSAVKSALIAKWAVDPTGEHGDVNTHPNDDAQLFESNFIENFLKSI